MAAATLASSDNAAAIDDRRLLELLIMVVVIHSLLPKEDDGELKDIVKELSMSINGGGDQSAVSKELLVITQRLLDAQLRLPDGGETEGRVEVSSSASDHQLMETAAAVKKKKKKRNKRNKAAAKNKGTKHRSWLGGGIISLLMMAVTFGSITKLSHIPRSDGSSEGNKAPPTLPPSASTSLRKRDLQSSDNIISSMSPSTKIPTWLPTTWPADVQAPIFSPADVSNPPMNSSPASVSPLAAVVQAPIFSPAVASNPPMNSVDESALSTCFDTPKWKDTSGRTCEWYGENDKPGCPVYNDSSSEGNMGVANDNCCYCGGGIRTCEDFRSKCQGYINVLGTDGDGGVKPLCDEAVSCSCEAGDHFKITESLWGYNETVGLYNECKCDFWSRLCEDTRGGVACDYAAEYCCGDYMYSDGLEYLYLVGQYDVEVGFWYLNSPQCYCDFFNYAQNEFGHTLTSKALIFNKEFSNPCSQFDNMLSTYPSKYFREFEMESLEAIYNATNGQNWTNNDGWMNEAVDHCQWYGISCDDEGLVTSIDLRDNNLAGQFPVYTRNFIPFAGKQSKLDESWQWSKFDLATLVKIKTLDLADNRLTGTIEYLPLYNLQSLTHFDVSGNQLSGKVDVLVTPSMTHADFSNNSFTAMSGFEKYKGTFHTLKYCDASNNAIQEDATELLENIPPNIEQFFASNNEMHGNLPASLNNLPKLRRFNMASNALSGELPVFAASTLSLQELDISFQTNGFTGSIPEDLLKLQSLNTLNLAGNKLAGTIPRAVGFMAMLEVFDLSDNRLDSSLPPELGMLDGSLKRLVLSNNALSGVIPSQIGQLHGATILLRENRFQNSTITAPRSLCLEREVKEFDLANDTTLCPIERNALSDFYDSAKGEEWTDRSNWTHEYASYCDWKGVTCDDNNNKKHVTKLQLSNNGLSGRISESIVNLTFIEVLDLSDNDIKGSIPTELGLLSNLIYLRLSYNALTGTAPEGLGEIKGLQLLQLQSNRITKMPIIPQLNDSIHGQSTFVTDCGVPSAFDKALECENCTMCCNANEDCHPQEETQMDPLNYGTFAAVLSSCFFIVCCMLVLVLYIIDRHRKGGINSTPAMEQKRRDEEYALSKIGKNSVYSYFVTNSKLGWLAAVTTVGIQVGILVFFMIASEANLQDDKIDIKFAWKCPRDTDACENRADLTDAGWFIFVVLMTAFLAKDIISGSKLIYYSAKIRHDRHSRIRYFFGGLCLCLIALFALYVSTIYNKAIATSNTELIANSVIVLFVMELDEWIFKDLEAINKKWTEHAAESETEEAEKGAKIEEIRDEIALHKAHIESQQEQIASQQEQVTSQQEELRKLREIVEKLQESQAAVAAAATSTTKSDSESVS